jgi:RHS repeat-associated protein
MAGNRGSCFGGTDGVEEKFTGKERDAETGLDFFEARYFGSAQGRFTSTDPVIMGPHKVTNPQNWNLYAYSRNNPLRFTDPTGEIINEDIDHKYKKRYKAWKAEFLKTKFGQALWDRYQNDQNFTLDITIGENAGGQQGAETNGYHWNSSGQLDAATITLGTKLNSGYSSGDNYPVSGSLRPDSGGTELSGDTIAATKLAHEFGHVEFTAGTPKDVFGLQNFLMPVWNSVFQATGQGSPDIERLMGGSPVQISTTREQGAEGAGAVPYLRDRFPGKPGGNMPERIQQAIQNFEKSK